MANIINSKNENDQTVFFAKLKKKIDEQVNLVREPEAHLRDGRLYNRCTVDPVFADQGFDRFLHYEANSFASFFLPEKPFSHMANIINSKNESKSQPEFKTLYNTSSCGKYHKLFALSPSLALMNAIAFQRTKMTKRFSLQS